MCSVGKFLYEMQQFINYKIRERKGEGGRGGRGRERKRGGEGEREGVRGNGRKRRGGERRGRGKGRERGRLGGWVAGRRRKKFLLHWQKSKPNSFNIISSNAFSCLVFTLKENELEKFCGSQWPGVLSLKHCYSISILQIFLILNVAPCQDVV